MKSYLSRAQQKFHSPLNRARPSCRDSRYAAASKGDTSGTTRGRRQRRFGSSSGMPCEDVGCDSLWASCSASTSWKNPERILSTSTEQRTATHSVADCRRTSTAEWGDNLLTFGATILASPCCLPGWILLIEVISDATSEWLSLYSSLEFCLAV